MSMNIPKDKVEVYAQALKDIQEENKGILNTRNIVDEARYPHHPLHEYFEWNDGKAGEEYRLQQARFLVRTVEVEIISPEGPITEKAYVNVDVVTDSGVQQNYVSLQTALKDDNYRLQIFAKALREINYWKDKYKHYERLAPIFRAVDLVNRVAKG